ncbi:hypothetical protein FNF29_03107 [Cafeteria roenbergensis]|uniref:Uncharacterized protein n=1 Tax=Cafeteria roenbergensis TaxID=33653 RepID=A0A5A8CJM4_CAFRO|nr:hypothetical protein FNF29_03107 [Cafeteria roenbergensis]|eukprot:KAA0153293.1 hypothetical protein FNF29_03107 [Cafeteria roenbergensis]
MPRVSRSSAQAPKRMTSSSAGGRTARPCQPCLNGVYSFRRPACPAGAPLRGWLTLPDSVDQKSSSPRPQGSPRCSLGWYSQSLGTRRSRHRFTRYDDLMVTVPAR